MNIEVSGPAGSGLVIVDPQTLLSSLLCTFAQQQVITREFGILGNTAEMSCVKSSV